MLAKSKLAAACAAAFAIASGSAFAQAVPAGYPADYQKVLDGAKKEGKVVIYSTTDTKAAAIRATTSTSTASGFRKSRSRDHSDQGVCRNTSPSRSAAARTKGRCMMLSPRPNIPRMNSGRTRGRLTRTADTRRAATSLRAPRLEGHT